MNSLQQPSAANILFISNVLASNCHISNVLASNVTYLTYWRQIVTYLTYWRQIVTSGTFFTNWKRLPSSFVYIRLFILRDWHVKLVYEKQYFCRSALVNPTPDCMLSFGVIYLHQCCIQTFFWAYRFHEVIDWIV